MEKLKRLIVSLTLVSVLAISAFAGEIQSPPCAPGEIQSPPCSSAPLLTDDPTVLSQTDTPPVDITSAIEETLMAFLLF